MAPRSFSAVSFLLLMGVVQAKCPNWCSQHGICTGPGDDAFCICEMGWVGDDCQTRLCPKGDDPLTTGQNERAITMTTAARGGFLEGNMVFTFNGESVTLPADGRQITSASCTAALSKLPNVKEVVCEAGIVDYHNGIALRITLKSFPTIPHENNLYSHDGNPPLSSFECDLVSEQTGSANGVSCEFDDFETNNLKEYAECSRHGTCNRDTAICGCNLGFKGLACDDITDDADITVHLAEGPFFKASVLKLRANRGASDEYKLIQASAGNKDVMTLDGNGELELSGKVSILTQSGGGAGGGNVGLSVPQGSIEAGSLSLSRTFLGKQHAQQGLHQPVLDVVMQEMGAKTGPLVRFWSNSTDFQGGMTIAADGSTVIDGAAFLVKGGSFTVADGDASFAAGLAVEGKVVVGLEGVTVAGGGVNIRGGGLGVIHTAHDDDGGADGSGNGPLALISVQDADYAGHVLRVEYKEVDDNGKPLPQRRSGAEDKGELSLISAAVGDREVFAVKGDGAMYVRHGSFNVEAGGVRVRAGGVQIESGGLEVEGGLKLKSGQLEFVSGEGIHIAEGGLSVSVEDASTAPMQIHAKHAHFAGAVADFTTSAAASEDFLFLSARANTVAAAVKGVNSASGSLSTSSASSSSNSSAVSFLNSNSVFEVNGKGKITTGDSIVAGGGLDVGGTVTLRSNVAMKPRTVRAGSEIRLNVEGVTFVTIEDDGDSASTNKIRMEGEVSAGQLLIIHNGDGQPTTGDISVPPAYTVLFIHAAGDPSGGGGGGSGAWLPLHVLTAEVAALNAITEFHAANDLDIGDVSFRAQNLLAGSNPPDHIAVYGGGGLLTMGKGLEWDSSRAILSTRRFKASEMAGGIDFKGYEAMNVALRNATFIGSVTVAGSVVTKGLVVGNGPYLDMTAPTQKMMKQDDPQRQKQQPPPKPLNGAVQLNKLLKLQAVQFDDALSQSRVGLVSEDVGAVMPEVVFNDGQGGQRVAYSHLVPVLVEATKALHVQNQELQADLQKMKNDMEEMAKRMKGMEQSVKGRAEL